jgi:cardiolipin synthase
VRRRLAVLLSLFVAIQGIIAVIVSVRGKRARRARIVSRPLRHASRDFEPIRLEHDDQHAKLYMHGDALFEDIVASIDSAADRVLVETFIWENDETGRTVRDALVRAAGRGVRVYVLWDWLLSDGALVDGFFPPEIEVYPFKPLTPRISSLRLRNVIRDHRKVIVVDDRQGFIGGFNIGDQYRAWRDTHLRLTGTTALELANAFVDFWNQHVPSTATRLPNVEGRQWDPHVLVQRNDPSLAIFPIRGMYVEAMDRASSRIWITNAYFGPDRYFRTALCQAARRGVDVRLLLPARSNHPLTDVLAHGMFSELLGAGVRVFLYRDFMVHAKTALIDDEWVTIGTANLDRWSMLGNYEINVEVQSEALASQVADMFEFDLDSCDELHLDGWHRRPTSWKVSEWFLGSLAPFM